MSKHSHFKFTDTAKFFYRFPSNTLSSPNYGRNEANTLIVKSWEVQVRIKIIYPASNAQEYHG